MTHYALYIKLLERKLPTQLLTVLESWLNTCTTCIRWNGRVSHCFSLTAGVRQGGVLSPLLFAICIDTIDRVKILNVYRKVGRLASEEVMLSLIRAKCSPILLNATRGVFITLA